MISSKAKKLAVILESENYRLFEPFTVNFRLEEKSAYFKESMRVFKELLEGNDSPYPLKLDFNLIHDEFVIILDEELSFNRYRKKTLQSTLYEKFGGLQLNQYKRYCRSYEPNCTKVGLRNDVWKNDKAEELFGKASQPGDFFANGSPGWKLNAFREFMQDVYSFEKKWNLYRISIYDNLLIDGQLQPLGKLLETGSDRYYQGIFNMIKMKLKLSNQ